MTNQPQIIASMLKTPDGTVLRSYYRHDYVTHTDKNGKEYMLDGGNEYVRCSANGDEEVITITTDDPFEVQREYFCWGTRGKDGRQPLVWKPLKDLDTEHIEAILDTQTQINGTYVQDLMEQELQYRNK